MISLNPHNSPFQTTQWRLTEVKLFSQDGGSEAAIKLKSPKPQLVIGQDSLGVCLFVLFCFVSFSLMFKEILPCLPTSSRSRTMEVRNLRFGWIERAPVSVPTQELGIFPSIVLTIHTQSQSRQTCVRLNPSGVIFDNVLSRPLSLTLILKMGMFLLK